MTAEQDPYAVPNPYRIPQVPDDTQRIRYMEPRDAQELIEQLVRDLRDPNLISPSFPSLELAEIMTNKSQVAYENALILLR